MKIVLPLLLLCFHYTTSYGQYTNASLEEIISTYSDEKLLVESSRLLEEGYYSAAEKIIDKLLSKNPENCNYNYRKGFVVADGRSDFARAIPYLEKAIKDIDKNYDMYSGSETSAAVDALYRLGKSYHRTGNLEKAEQNYTAFLAQAGKKTDLTAAAQLGLDQLALAKKSMEFPKKNVTVLNLGSSVNSSFPDYSPVISFDGSALYFTSRRPWDQGQTEDDIDLRYDLYPEDIYVAYKDFDEAWVDPVRLEFCEPGHNEASISVSPDERRIYVYLDSIGNGDIYYSDFATNRFRDIQKVKTEGVNSEFWDTHCTVSPDGRTMYFASERPEGLGGRDIYRVVKLPDGSWGKPFNLGPSINSPFDEDSPFMASDNRTLYFASNGPKSMGGFDIMVSVIDEDNNWSSPINLGYPLNSTADDLFYTETIDGRRGYITSTRGDSKGEKDIYEIQNDYLSTRTGAILKGKIITLNGRQMPEDITVTLACSNCGDEIERTVYPRVRDGVFMMNMDPCHEYEVVLHHSNGATEFYRETIKTDCSKDKEEIYREMFLDADKMIIVPPKVDTVPPVDTTPVVVVVDTKYDPINYKRTFGYNKNTGNEDASSLSNFYKEIEKQLKAGRKDMVVEIYSSASYVPTTKFKDNQELSETRANNLKEKIEAHFAKTKYAGQVQVKVVSAVVSGPAYEGDNKNTEKYRPYQFVEAKVK